MNKIVRILVIAGVLIAIFIIVSISARDKSVKRETPPLTADTTGLNKEVPVVGVKLEPTEFFELISVTGLLEAWNRTMISSETGGRVIKWNSELGERLKAGQVVVSFDDEVAELQWHRAEAALESAIIAASKAKRDYERQKSLFEKGDLSENIIESVELSMKNAQAGLKAAEAAAGLAKRAFNETKVKMPFNGGLSAKLVVIGQSVPPGTPVAEVVQTNPIKLTIGLSEKDIVKVHPGQEVFIHTIGWGDKEFTGRVFAVGSATDVMTRQFPVEISIPNKHLEIKPGMAATAQILVKVYKEALVVSQEVVTDYGDIARCFLAEGDRAAERDVKVSQPQSGKVMFLSGVTSGDTIITVGKASLKDGQKLGLTVE